jgi:hypothetical protein
VPVTIAVDQLTLGSTVQDSAGTSVVLTTTAAVASNGFITCFVTWYDGVGGAMTLSTVAGGGLTWSIAFQFKAANGANVAIAYAQAPSGLAITTAITATYSASVPAGRSITAASWTGVKTTSPVDGTPPAGTTGSTTAWATGSMSVQAGSLALGMSMQITTNLTSTPTAPSTELFDYTSGVGGMGATAAYRIETSVGSVTVAGTWSAAASQATLGVAFLAAPADYRSAVLADSPVLYWRLGETAGATTAADSSPNARPGTYSGAPTLGVPGLIVNDPNTAATLARASAQSVFRANEAALQITAALSLEIWLKLTALPTAGQFHPVITKNASTNEIYAIDLNNPSGTVQIRFHIQTTAATVQTNVFTPAAGAVAHIVCTYDGANMATFVNGVQLGTNTAKTGAIATSTDQLTVGSWSNGGDFLNATVDEVAVYSTALSPARILAHYNMGATTFQVLPFNTGVAQMRRQRV